MEQSDGITAIAQVKPIIIGVGGKMTDKDTGAGIVENKILLGDKYGQV